MKLISEKNEEKLRRILSDLIDEASEWRQSGRIDELKRPEDAEGRYDKDEQEQFRKLTELGDAYLREIYQKRRPALGMKPRIQAGTETRKAKMPETDLERALIKVRSLAERAAVDILRRGGTNGVVDKINTSLGEAKSLARKELDDLLTVDEPSDNTLANIGAHYTR
jgi:hypothetical protein